MEIMLAGIAFDCADPRRLSAFWATALGYVTAEDGEGWIALRPPEGAGPLLGFQRVPEPKVVKNRVHLDLKPAGTETLDAVVARLVDLGGRVARPVAEEPGNAHVIMQDPEGNEFCVVEA